MPRTTDYEPSVVQECARDRAAPGETCFFFLARQKAKLPTPEGGLSRLVIFFSGGEMGCGEPFTKTDLTTGYGDLANLYAANGFVFACAQIFMSNDSSAKFAFSDEAGRVNTLVNRITKRAKNLGWWNGDELLFSGVSHGASAPVFAMRHSTVEDSAEWKGATKTAACFFDGISDMDQLGAWLRRGGEQKCVEERNRAYCSRYFGRDNCARQLSDKAMLDSMQSGPHAASASDFSIGRWKAVSCGRARSFPSACSFLADAIPDAQQDGLCEILNDNRHGLARCERADFPDVSHSACTDVNTSSSCLDWFVNLPSRR